MVPESLTHSETPTACANCKKPANRACTGCSDIPQAAGKYEKTYYCHSTCQKAHWRTHKELCNRLQDVKHLYRAGSVLQAIIYELAEGLYTKHIDKIEEKDGKIYLWESMYEEMVFDLDLFVPFPQTVSSSPHKKAILVQHYCDDALAWMARLLIHYIGDITTDIKEVSIMIKTPKVEIVHLDSEGKAYQGEEETPHKIWVATLRGGGGEHAIDLTCAQFGGTDPIMPFGVYHEEKIRGILPQGPERAGYLPIGSTRRYCMEVAQKLTGVGFGGIHSRVHYMVSEHIMDLILCKEKESEDICNLLKLPWEKFEHWESAVAKMVRDEIRSILARERSKGEEALAELKAKDGNPQHVQECLAKITKKDSGSEPPTPSGIPDHGVICIVPPPPLDDDI